MTTREIRFWNPDEMLGEDETGRAYWLKNGVVFRTTNPGQEATQSTGYVDTIEQFQSRGPRYYRMKEAG